MNPFARVTRFVRLAIAIVSIAGCSGGDDGPAPKAEELDAGPASTTLRFTENDPGAPSSCGPRADVALGVLGEGSPFPGCSDGTTRDADAGTFGGSVSCPLTIDGGTATESTTFSGATAAVSVVDANGRVVCISTYDVSVETKP